MNVIAVKGRRLAVFDFPAGHTKFIKAVRMVLNGVAPYRIDMVYGHRHTDHIGGATGFRNWARRTYPRAHIDIWGTRGTFNFLKQRRPKEPRPNKFVPAAWGRAIYLGPGFTIRLRIIGGHVHDDMMAIFPMPRGKVFIHLADFVAPRFAQIDSLGVTIDLLGYIQGHRDLLKYDFDLISPGHVNLGSKKDVRDSMLYAMDTVQIAAEVVATETPAMLAGLGLERVRVPGTLEFGNRNFEFKAIWDSRIERCFRKLMQRWGCKLAGVDVYARSHCHTAQFYNLLET